VLHETAIGNASGSRANVRTGKALQATKPALTSSAILGFS
jgi:hypothetical protein